MSASKKVLPGEGLMATARFLDSGSMVENPAVPDNKIAFFRKFRLESISYL